MKEVIATIEEGQIRLPEKLSLPDGTMIRLMWEEQTTPTPYEPEPLTEEDVRVDLEWARKNRFPT